MTLETDPGNESQESRFRHSTRQTLRPRRISRRPNAGTQPDVSLTDPEPNVDTRQARIRNMRSKCRCSCVLQFTRHLRVSSVLHRPLSQMIHCIVLYLVFRQTSLSAFKKLTNLKLTALQGEITVHAVHGQTPADKQSARPEPCYRTDTQVGPQELTTFVIESREISTLSSMKPDKPIMILPQVHLRKPCYDFYFL